ncbi:hypothetical protein BBAD15_g518 [Beauveria bassiana D1-5]|uniref:Uncharacterized protein n=1 Tax=Beauveria bassiana D1-5 TaxID=1245745 RepID=A0A0A2W0X8_BEABA|nr:hypothetical protein BBAD15_g518 [Beauveria bassiana D1-5]
MRAVFNQLGAAQKWTQGRVLLEVFQQVWKRCGGRPKRREWADDADRKRIVIGIEEPASRLLAADTAREQPGGTCMAFKREAVFELVSWERKYLFHANGNAVFGQLI